MSVEECVSRKNGTFPLLSSIYRDFMEIAVIREHRKIFLQLIRNRFEEKKENRELNLYIQNIHIVIVDITFQIRQRKKKLLVDQVAITICYSTP